MQETGVPAQVLQTYSGRGYRRGPSLASGVPSLEGGLTRASMTLLPKVWSVEGFSWELVSDAETRVLFQTYGLRICLLAGPLAQMHINVSDAQVQDFFQLSGCSLLSQLQIAGCELPLLAQQTSTYFRKHFCSISTCCFFVCFVFKVFRWG